MRVLIIIDHPWQGSFNHAVLRSAIHTLQAGGHSIDVLDLHQEDFDPVMRVEELAVYKQGGILDPKVSGYQAQIEQAEHLVFIFPVWWEVMPALLKGFIDKVFLPEWAFHEADVAPMLGHIRGGTVITTMGAPQPIHTSVEAVLCKGVLEFCGVQQTRWFNICEVSKTTPEVRAAWLDGVMAYLAAL